MDFRKLPRSILWDFTHGFASVENLGPLAAGASAAAASSAFEADVEEQLRGSFGFLGDSGDLLGHPITAAVGVSGFAVAAGFTEDRRFRAFSYSLVRASIMERVLTHAIKAAVSRTRPNGANNNSFASGHAATAFTLATVATEHYGPKLAIPAYAMGVWVAAARIEQGKHFLSDVVFGASVGVIAGRIASRGTRAQFSKRRVSIYPRFVESGVGLTVLVTW